MSASELLVNATTHKALTRSEGGERATAFSRVRLLIMLGLCGFPALVLYGVGLGRQDAARRASSAVIAKVRISRAPAEALPLLVRTPLPPPVSPKPTSTPAR